jgi:hypothetical protein
MYLCHVCMNKTRIKYISFQGYPTVPSLFFLPTLAHFIGISTLTFVRLSGTSENWRRTSRSCITAVRRDKWKNPQTCRYDGQHNISSSELLNRQDKCVVLECIRCITQTLAWLVALFYHFWYVFSSMRFDCFIQQ